MRTVRALSLVVLVQALVLGCGATGARHVKAASADAGAPSRTPPTGLARRVGSAASLPVVAAAATAPRDRMPAIAPKDYTEAQRRAVNDFIATRKVPVFGPFIPLMRSPEVMKQARGMGDYLRYKSAIGTTLSELVTLIVAREWTQDYVWYVHQPIAAKSGIKREIIDSIRSGARPVGMSEDQEIVYDFSTELHRFKHVSDRTYDRALKRFGETGVIDLVSLNGYYTFLAMTMNTTRMALPKGAKRLPRFPD